MICCGDHRCFSLSLTNVRSSGLTCSFFGLGRRRRRMAWLCDHHGLYRPSGASDAGDLPVDGGAVLADLFGDHRGRAAGEQALGDRDPVVLGEVAVVDGLVGQQHASSFDEPHRACAGGYAHPAGSGCSFQATSTQFEVPLRHRQRQTVRRILRHRTDSPHGSQPPMETAKRSAVVAVSWAASFRRTPRSTSSTTSLG